MANWGKKWDYSLGGTYSQTSQLARLHDRIVQNSDSSQLQNYEVSSNYLTLPNAYGGGLALTYKQKYTFVADIKYQDWTAVSSKNVYPGKDYSLTSSYRGSIGFEVLPEKDLLQQQGGAQLLPIRPLLRRIYCRSTGSRSRIWAPR